MLKVWNASLIVATFVLALTRHVPRALRHPRLDPRVRRVHARAAVPGLHRDRDPRLGGAHREPAASLKSEGADRLLWSRARRSSCSTTSCCVGLCFVIFWGTFFPLISEAVTGRQGERGAALVQPIRDAARAGAGAAVGDRPGVRLAAGEPDGSAPRASPVPLAVAAGAFVLLLAAHERRRPARGARDVHDHGASCWPWWAGVLARRVGAPGDDRRALPLALGRLVGRNRRRYGGYIVHVGIAVLFLGVAASSAFLEQRDVRLSPGGDDEGRRLRDHLREPTAAILSTTARAPARRSRWGRSLRVRKGDEHLDDAPVAQLLPGHATAAAGWWGASSRARPRARSTSAGVCAATSGRRSSPTLPQLEQGIAAGNRRFANVGVRAAGR